MLLLTGRGTRRDSSCEHVSLKYMVQGVQGGALHVLVGTTCRNGSVDCGCSREEGGDIKAPGIHVVELDGAC